jgi:predicted NBD/HSP70 family sugar kinase
VFESVHTSIAEPSPPPRGSLDALLAYAWDAEVFTSNDAMPVVGLTRSTTIEAIDELIDRGLVRELTNTRANGDLRKGRPSRRFEFCSDAAVLVGIDAGRAHLTTTVADLRGRAIHRSSRELDSSADAADIRRTEVAAALADALEASGCAPSDVLAICAGVPAPVDAAGRSPRGDGFWQRMNPDLVGLLSEWAPIVRVENDASLAAVAEGTVGAAAGCRNFVALLAGNRLGAGVVIDGNLLRGANGGAGEMRSLDHTVGVESADGIGLRLVTWALDDISAGRITPEHPLAQLAPAELTGQAVLELARTGDPIAGALVDRVAAVLARVVGAFSSFYDPERVIVSGAIADGIGEVLAVARPLLGKELDLLAPALVSSTLGADVVAIGAVSAAVEAARSGVLSLTRHFGAARAAR